MDNVTLNEILSNIINNPQVQFITVHILLNFLVAVGVSIYQKTFAINRIWEVFGKKLVPFVATYFTFDMVGQILGGGLISVTAFTAIEAALLADLLDNLQLIPQFKPYIDRLPELFAKNKRI